jgi:transcriptional regulator GlxA family with amidase domain
MARRRLAKRAEDYLRANLAEPFNLSDFAAAVGTSQRMFEHHFKRTFGVAPQVWYPSMKLNAVRRDLRHARSSGERISDIAMRCGFMHLGRFSGEYRRLFGALPRETVLGK